MEQSQLQIILDFDAETNKFSMKVNRESTMKDISLALCNGMLTTMNIAAKAQEDSRPAKEGIYDFMNEMFTSVLENFMPDKELRADLDTETILELENKKLNEHVAQD